MTNKKFAIRAIYPNGQAPNIKAMAPDATAALALCELWVRSTIHLTGADTVRLSVIEDAKLDRSGVIVFDATDTIVGRELSYEQRQLLRSQYTGIEFGCIQAA